MPTQNHVVSREEWMTARKELLREEKALLRYKDFVTEKRQALPWVLVDKAYTFEEGERQVTLRDLFAEARQLIVYHFMFGPEWDAGCTGCTQVADTFALARQHLENRDTRLVAVSRTSSMKIAGYKTRMGWEFPWYSSLQSDFNFDFLASDQAASDQSTADQDTDSSWRYQAMGYDRDETHGFSVFVREDDQIYHTYSCFNRQVELYMVNLQLLDLVPGGRRNELEDGRRA
ncbi:MAG: DUF899 family protein [Pseudomonadota bacterium]